MTAIKAANLTAALSGSGQFNVFVPKNKVFEKLTADVLKHFLESANIRELQAVLEYHVLNGAIHTGDLKREQTVKTLEGSDVLDSRRQ